AGPCPWRRDPPGGRHHWRNVPAHHSRPRRRAHRPARRARERWSTVAEISCRGRAHGSKAAADEDAGASGGKLARGRRCSGSFAEVVVGLGGSGSFSQFACSGSFGEVAVTQCSGSSGKTVAPHSFVSRTRW